MKFPHFIAIAAVLLATVGVGTAQTSSPCQFVSVESSAVDTQAGTQVIFNAKLNTVIPTAKPEFRWEITGGTITAGQGTSSITVDTSGLVGQSIDATVSVAGVLTVCTTSATKSVRVFEGPGCGIAFDEFGDIAFEDEKARLDNFAIQLSMHKEHRGHITIFAGRKTYPGEASDRLQRAKNYLVEVRNIDADRIVTVDGGYREEFSTTLYIVPPGVDLPSLEADVSPTEIVLTKRRPKAVAHKTH